MIQRWFEAFLLTLALEVPVYLYMLRLRWPQRVTAALGTSALTHPYVWFVLPAALMPALGYWGYVAVAEVLVILVEALLCAMLGEAPKRALGIAALANALSFGIGWWILQG